MRVFMLLRQVLLCLMLFAVIVTIGGSSFGPIELVLTIVLLAAGFAFAPRKRGRTQP